MNSHFWLSILPILGPPSHQGPFTQRHQLQRHDQRLSEGRAVAACAEFAAGHAGTRGARKKTPMFRETRIQGFKKKQQKIGDRMGFCVDKNWDSMGF